MLVKFLSFTASVIGTARYKAVFLSCLVLVFSIAGIVGMALWQGNNPPIASTLEKPAAEDNAQQGSPQLGNSRKQAIRNENVNPPDNQQPGDATQNTPTPTGTGNTARVLEITLSKADWSLAPGETTDLIFATVPNDKSVEWTIDMDSAPGLSIVSQEQSAAALQFQIRRPTDQNTTQAGTYQVIIRAKDTAQNSVVPPKTITVKIL